MGYNIHDEIKRALEKEETIFISFDPKNDIFTAISQDSKKNSVNVMTEVNRMGREEKDGAIMEIMSLIAGEDFDKSKPYIAEEPIVVSRKGKDEVFGGVLYTVDGNTVNIVITPRWDLEEKRILISHKAGKKLNTMISHYSESGDIDLGKKEISGGMVEKAIHHYYETVFVKDILNPLN